MPTSALGSLELTRTRQRGFTLLELLVVVSLVALATAGVSLALPDPADTQLDREAQRLNALLEAGRAQARTTGVAVVWRSEPGGFSLGGQRRAWLHPDTRVRVVPTGGAPQDTVPSPRELILGPEPLMAAHTLALSLGTQSLWLGTDGLRPFQVLATPPEAVMP